MKLLRGATAFLSAFLLFLVQPIVGKRILPWFGGAAPVWTTCLVFFQVLVVVGYSYGHVVVRYLSPRRQAMVHVGLLLVGCLMLPIDPSARWKPASGGAPLLEILGLLATSVGLPALALSTTGPLVQAWLAREEARDVGKADKGPYGLFALSNLGSMAGLLGYPLLLEPAMGVRAQAVIWSVGFGVFVALAGALAVRAGGLAGGARRARSAGTVAVPEQTGSPEKSRSPEAEGGATGRLVEPAPGVGTMALWGVLAASPSILLVGMTRSLSLEVAPVPLLWVLPLATYLLSFTLVFGRPAWCSRNLSAALLLGGLAVALWAPPSSPSTLELRARVAVVVGALFAFSTVGHAELVRLRPDPRHLTSFYLMIAVGGAVGAILAGVVAPAVLDSDLEVPIGVVLATGTFLFVHLPETGPARAGAGARQGTSRGSRLLLLLAITGGLGAALLQESSRHRVNAIALGRSFHSSLRVGDAGEGADARRTLSHGRTVHGLQFLDPLRSRWPTAYYGETSGAGIALRAGEPGGAGRPAQGAAATAGGRARNVGVVGLGVGTLVSYGRAGDRYRVYEIDPLVIDFARRHFRYLAEAEAEVAMVPGDGRLSLEQEPPNGFDVLVVDAFSGDAIPAHLLTREAFEVYGRHLAPGGILAVHTSNRYLDLAAVVKRSGDAAGFQVALIRSDPDDVRGVFSATWVLAARTGLLDDELVKRHGEEIEVPPSLRTWTDDDSSLVPILR